MFDQGGEVSDVVVEAAAAGALPVPAAAVGDRPKGPLEALSHGLPDMAIAPGAMHEQQGRSVASLPVVDRSPVSVKPCHGSVLSCNKVWREATTCPLVVQHYVARLPMADGRTYELKR